MRGYRGDGGGTHLHIAAAAAAVHECGIVKIELAAKGPPDARERQASKKEQKK